VNAIDAVTAIPGRRMVTATAGRLWDQLDLSKDRVGSAFGPRHFACAISVALDILGSLKKPCRSFHRSGDADGFGPFFFFFFFSFGPGPW
jgi:hypothetical protein